MELAIRPTHDRRIVFRKVFGSTPDRIADAAIRFTMENCLPDAEERRRWIAAANRATLFMLVYDGPLTDLANGRMAEFKFLILALEAYEA